MTTPSVLVGRTRYRFSSDSDGSRRFLEAAKLGSSTPSTRCLSSTSFCCRRHSVDSLTTTRLESDPCGRVTLRPGWTHDRLRVARLLSPTVTRRVAKPRCIHGGAIRGTVDATGTETKAAFPPSPMRKVCEAIALPSTLQL